MFSIESADDLASALRRRGIEFQQSEPLEFSELRFAKIDEGRRLSGEGLRIDILRIEDRRTYEMARSAQSLLTALAGAAAQEVLEPPTVVARHPFVVVIYAEPEPGKTRRIVEEILPDRPDG